MADQRSEFAFIDWIRARTAAHPSVPLGIGDDAALLRIAPPGECLLTVDMLMDGVDFRLSETDPRAIGRKALAVSLSDIAAMAGRPLAALVSVALPHRVGRQLGEQLHAGIQALADEFEVALAGGDTNSWDGPLVVSVTVVGEPTSKGPVRRSGAQAGDWIMVTGELGGSISGKHLSFQPRICEALALNQAADLHAMIDISDGLAADLYHILDESLKGAVLRSDAVPISPAARKTTPQKGEKTPLEHALGDGEDFELLFTVSADDGRRLLEKPPIAAPLAHIGEITAERTCRLIDAGGRVSDLQRLGWAHAL